MPKKQTHTTTVRLTPEDQKRLERVQELTDRTRTTSDILRHALAVYAAQLERDVRKGTTGLSTEVREIAKVVVEEVLAGKAAALKKARRAPREIGMADIITETHLTDKRMVRWVRGEIDKRLDLLIEVLGKSPAE